jgi:hypothetical protein
MESLTGKSVYGLGNRLVKLWGSLCRVQECGFDEALEARSSPCSLDLDKLYSHTCNAQRLNCDLRCDRGLGFQRHNGRRSFRLEGLRQAANPYLNLGVSRLPIEKSEIL